jgi:DNA-directed RNA polymerase specialized sigma24 family protein
MADHGDEIVRLLLMQMRGVEISSQADAIRKLGEAGIAPNRIAELLDTTLGTVNVTLARERKRRAKKTQNEGARYE